jgi:hypothetical protein
MVPRCPFIAILLEVEEKKEKKEKEGSGGERKEKAEGLLQKQPRTLSLLG